jgi:hypothetical protein
LYLPPRKKAVQGRSATYSDELILAIAVYQHLWGFKYASKLLENLKAQGWQVPAASTYSERKKLLLGSVIVAVKALCGFGFKPTPVHLDSKMVPTSEYARANRVKLPGAVGWDHINECYYIGLRLHASVDDSGWLRRVVLRKANQHDVKVAPVLLDGLSYSVATGDKAYISQELKRSVAANAVDLVTPKRKNQAPPSRREKRLLKHHKQVESTFSNLDLLGLNIRRYRKPWGTVFHLMSVLLADFLNRLFLGLPSFALPSGFLFLLFRIGVS